MSLGMELSKVLFREEPGLLNCEMGANARACAALADVLGALLATVIKRNGTPAYVDAMKLVARRIHESAIKTFEAAENITPNVTEQ